MAATFDIGKIEGRDRFPNLDKACQQSIECIQVRYFFALYTAVWSTTVNTAFKIQETKFFMVRTLLVSPMLIYILILVPLPYLSSHLFQFHAGATMPMKALCIMLAMLLRYQLLTQLVMVCSRLQGPDQ